MRQIALQLPQVRPTFAAAAVAAEEARMAVLPVNKSRLEAEEIVTNGAKAEAMAAEKVKFSGIYQIKGVGAVLALGELLDADEADPQADEADIIRA